MDAKADAVNYNLDRVEKQIQGVSQIVSGRLGGMRQDDEDGREVNRVMNQSYD